MKALPASIFSLLVISAATVVAADPAAELASFSVFDKVDINELAKGDAKTMHGPPMNGRYLSVQSCYVTPGAPAQQIEAMHNWNPARHRELKVLLHADLPGSPSPASFSKLKDAPDESSVKALISKTEKVSSDLQISKDEAKKASGAKFADFWSEVLAGRAKNFAATGAATQPPYDYSGESIVPAKELISLIGQQDKIYKQFSNFLKNETGIMRLPGPLKPELYWELLDVDDQGVVTLGASYNRAGSNGSVQAADVLYYASGGYYVALTLYQLWPVTANGKPSTLVWRGDLISSAALAELHGVERLGSESAMMKDISKAIALFRKDTTR